MRKTALLFLFLGSAPFGFLPAAAEAGFYCADPSLVRRNTGEDCMNNEYVSEAAVLCLEKLEGEIQKAKSTTTVAGAAHLAASRSSQEGREKNAAVDFGFSKETLDGLIRHARQAQEEVIYLDQSELVYPEDYDEPEVTGMDTATYLKTTPCYGENHEVITHVLEDFDYYISDLEHARDMAADLLGNSEKNAKGLKAVGKKNSISNSSGKGPGSATKNWRPSDISGTKDKTQKK